MKLILSPSPEPMALVSPDNASGYFFLADLTFHLRYKDNDAFLEAIFRQKAKKTTLGGLILAILQASFIIFLAFLARLSMSFFLTFSCPPFYFHFFTSISILFS